MSWVGGTHLLGQTGPTDLAGPAGLLGLKRGDGIGFHLTPGGNYDLQNRKVINIDTPDDHKVDDDYNTRIRDLKRAVNKKYLNDNFLKDKDGSYVDLRQLVIENTEAYYDGLYDDNDLVSKAYVDTENTNKTLPSMIKRIKIKFFIMMVVEIYIWIAKTK